MVIYVFQFFILSLTAVIGAEFVLRKKGRTPGIPSWMDNDELKIEPNGKFFAEHPKLGWVHLPGRYTIHLSDNFSFTVTQRENGLRVTRPLHTYEEMNPRPEIWVFGCSFTHGWSLDDDETFCWQLQENLDEYEIVNCGTDAYGTLQSLLLLQERLQKQEKPTTVILTYAAFHDNRNTVSRSWKKILSYANKMGPIPLPCARLDREGTLKIQKTQLAYRNFPLMEYSALVTYLEKKYNSWLDRRYKNREVSKVLIKRFSEVCKKHDIEFVVAGIWKASGTTEVLDFCKTEGIHSVDISVEVGDGFPEHNNRPHDHHPSALANQKYAQKLEVFLTEAVTPSGEGALGNFVERRRE